MSHLAQTFFICAGLCYLAALMAAFLPLRWSFLSRVLLIPALGCNLVTVGLRYYQAWPMLPMHLGPMALPLCLGLLMVFLGRASRPGERRVLRIILTTIVCLVTAAIFFPKDFYLPFLKSKTLIAHAFLWFALLAKGCCAISAAWALCAWPFVGDSSASLRPAVALQSSLRWAALGFGLWTVSMFCGELWCYLGWGTPVVWEDPALTLTMAGWFFYACVLHLHLTKTWNLQARAIFVGLGGLLMLSLSCLPDFGPFRTLVMP
ncbi:MAG: cytochrome c biogenesis protein CcsA [Desulfobulbus sp.]|nr:cytochrome c biogenesis protein CcsA [Desulfobulbus sp.]